MPLRALKLHWLVRGPPPASSFWQTTVRADTDEPVKTPRIVSKLLPAVETVTLPEDGAVQDHQTEAPPLLPAMAGSPASLVPPTFEPVTVTGGVPLAVEALAYGSLTGPLDTAAPACVTLNDSPATISV